MAMMIAVTDLGVGTGHSSVGDQHKPPAILGVPDGYQVAYLLGIGYPADARSSASANRTGGPSMRLSTTDIGDVTNWTASQKRCVRSTAIGSVLVRYPPVKRLPVNRPRL